MSTESRYVAAFYSLGNIIRMGVLITLNEQAVKKIGSWENFNDHREGTVAMSSFAGGGRSLRAGEEERPWLLIALEDPCLGGGCFQG